MPYQLVIPVIDSSVRGLCYRPYPGHKYGCPNHGKRPSCPPQAPLLGDVLDLDKPIWAVWTMFDLASHVEKMRAKHPNWTERQCRNCLYWQSGSRKKLKEEVRVRQYLTYLEDAIRLAPKHLVHQPPPPGPYPQTPRTIVIYCPEAMGVNVTATMASVRVILEWPPVNVTYQVALVGYPKERPH